MAPIAITLIYLLSLAGNFAVSDTVASDRPQIIGFNPSNASFYIALEDQTPLQETPLLVDISLLSDRFFQQMETINVRNADLRDILRGIATQYNINLVIDNQINEYVTVRLSEIPVIDAILFLCEEYGLELRQSGNIIRIFAPLKPEPPPELPKVIDLYVDDEGKLSLELFAEDLGAVIRKVSLLSGLNILIRQGVSGELTGMLKNVPLHNGLETLLANNGFSIRKRDDIYVVDRLGMGGTDNDQHSNMFWVNVTGDLVSLEVVNAPVSSVLREIAYQSNANLITYTEPTGTITAKANGLTLESTFNFIFRGSNITYRKEEKTWHIGDRNISGISTTRLIRLHHIRADGIIDLLPDNLVRNTTIKVIREQNGLMVIGTNDLIFELEQFIKQIDHPTPQILIEALVVDFEESDIFELGVRFGRNIRPDSSFFGSFLSFDNDGFRLQEQSRGLNNAIGFAEDVLGTRIGRLPPDFYMRVNALSREGRINIRSRPQIATLNGHPASISIGTTQYFILRSSTPLQSPNQIITQESERFEKIEANISLRITPWVSSSGVVTTEILPEFSTPIGQFNPEIPPTINTRVLDSTVRLQDGETIILGGLIQDSEISVHNKIPILGSIPILGRLFRNRSREIVKSELVIFITPHVFYGDDEEIRRWEQLGSELLGAP